MNPGGDSKPMHWQRFLTGLLLAVSCAMPAAEAAKGPLHVLIVHAYSQEYPWTKGQHEGFVAALTQGLKSPPQISVEYLETKKRGLEADYVDEYAELLRAKYAPLPPDAVYVSDDNGLLFAMSSLRHIFTEAPIFFSGVNDFGVLGGLDRERFTGVMEKKHILRNIELLELLQPGSRQVLIIGDGSNTYTAIETDIKNSLQQRPDISADYIATDRMGEMLSGILRYPDRPLLLTTLGGMRDAGGRLLPLADTLRQIASVTHGLVISMEDAYLLPGVHGGFVTSSRAQGREAAGLLLEWQAGKSLSSLEVMVDSPNEYILDASELQRLGVEIPPSLIKQTRVLNPLPGFFERNQSLLLSVIVLMSGVLMFSVFMLVINLGRQYE